MIRITFLLGYLQGHVKKEFKVLVPKMLIATKLLVAKDNITYHQFKPGDVIYSIMRNTTTYK